MTLKTSILATSTILVSVLGFLVALELVLRLLPVGTGLHAQATNAGNPISRFEPDREFVFSDEWNFAIVNHGRVNNAGFVNDHDYQTNDPRPLIAVVGDSYVEAQMIPYEETFHGRLQTRLCDLARVYSFGASGTALSQYLGFAEYASKAYRPQLVVFSIVGNDFDESLYKYKPAMGSYSYVYDQSVLKLVRSGEYNPSRVRRFIRQLALARYLFLNLQISSLYSFLEDVLGVQDREYIGNTLADASQERVADSVAGIHAFFRDLPQLTGLPPESIVFVLDGVRDEIYDTGNVREFEDGFFYVMRDRFITIARGLGYEVVDLHPRFAEHFKKHGQRFEFPTDGHWNSLGHAVAAEAIQASEAFQRFEAQASPHAARAQESRRQPSS